MKKWMKTVLIAVVGIILVACGNGGSEEDTSSSEGAADGEQSSDNTVMVAVENASQPLSFTNSEGELDGYEIDILDAINQATVDFNIEVESVSAEATQVGLDSGKYAFIGGGLYQTEERLEYYAFPEESTGASIIRIYVHESNDDIQSLDDLVGKNVAPVTPNGGIFNLLTSYNEENPDNQIEINLGESGDHAQRLQSIHDQQYDALVIPTNLNIDGIIEDLDLDVKPVEEPVQVNETYFMFAPGQEELMASFDEAVSQLKDDGTLPEISEKWFGENVFEYNVNE
jgi:L-cystine transport system substrate-binding protein